MNLPLGISTWTLNGLAPSGIAHVLDGGPHYLPEHGPGVRRFADEMADAILGSEIRSVEVWHNWGLYDDDVLQPFMRLADAGLIGSMHAPFGHAFDISSLNEDIRKAGVAACRKAAGVLHRLGGDVLTVHGGTAGDPCEIPLRTARCVRSLREISDFCVPLGIRVALEVIVGDVVGSSGSEVRAILEQVARPNVGACIDVNHVFPPEHLVPTVRELGSRIFSLHISDYDGIEEKHWLPMRGVIEWGALIGALEAVGYVGPFPYEVRLEARTVEKTVQEIVRNYRELSAL